MSDSGEQADVRAVASNDRVLRAITDDGAFRVITLESTTAVRDATHAQKVTGESARLFADVLTAAVLVRESMSPDLRVQLILQSGDGKSRMVADANPDGSCRGVLMMGQGKTDFELGEGALLQCARTLQNGAIQQGVVAIPREGGVSEALMQYMQQSEQVVTMCAVGTFIQDGEIVRSGGYLVQLLPEVAEGPLMVMTERLKDFTTIEPLLEKGVAEPKHLLDELLYGMKYTEVGERNDLRFACNCSQTRVAATLATLPRADIEDLIKDGRLLDIECDYCHKRYEFAPEQLRGMLAAN